MSTKSISASWYRHPALYAALLSGLMLTASFPNVDAWFLSWIALAPLCWIGFSQLPKAAFRWGLLAGWVHYMTLMYWLVPTLTTYGHLPLFLTVPMLVLLAAYLALYSAVFAWLLAKLKPGPWGALILIPVLWTALEWVRCWLLSGLPWALLGYTQYQQIALIQIADLFGVYGVSFLVAAVNGMIALFLWAFLNHRSGDSQIPRSALLTAVGALTVVFSGVLYYGHQRLNTISTWIQATDHKTVAAIQGNISQDLKWEPEHLRAAFDTYLRLSESAADAELVVWPETALPFYIPYDQSAVDYLKAEVARINTDFLIGAPTALETGQDQFNYQNSAYLIKSDRTIEGAYHKAHLVPFGEYVPLKEWLPFLGNIVAQVGDFIPGEKGVTLPWRDHNIGMLICYELIFPDLTRAQVQNGADLLINITNDAWYGRTSAPYQHFSFARFRAIESRRSLVRAANTGISGFIDPAGRVSAATPLFEEAVSSQPVAFLTVDTFYSTYGDLLPMGCMGVVFLFGVRRYLGSRKD